MNFCKLFFVFVFCYHFAYGQIVSKSSALGENYIQSIIQANNGGYLGLTIKDTTGYKNLMLIRLNDSLNVLWTKIFFNSEFRYPSFIKNVHTSSYLIGSYTDSSALLMETDSSGIVINQWSINDSIIIVDAIRIANGGTYFLFARNNNGTPFGNLRSTGIGYINPSGIIQSLYWSPNVSHPEVPIAFAESSSNNLFVLTHRESLNYWDCWLSVTDTIGNRTNGHRYEISYDIQLHRKLNLNYIISGQTTLGFTGPTSNFFIHLNSFGNLTSIKGIQFLNASNYYQALSGIKCIVTPDGGLFCAGKMDNIIYYFKLNANNSVSWAYSLPNTTNYPFVNTVLNCTDNGYLIEGHFNNTCVLIKCDSNGINNCAQFFTNYTLSNLTFFNSLGTNPLQQPLNFTSNAIPINTSSGNYLLDDQCLSANVKIITEDKNVLFINFDYGNLSIKLNGFSKMNFVPFELYDMKGNLLMRGTLEKNNDDSFYTSIFPENISSGIYLIKVKPDNIQLVSKFIISN